MAGVPLPPGWHGKLPALGDFASRRLGADFIEPWDAWLAAGLLHLRAQHPQTWLDAYLGGPSWRFLLLPGVLPGPAGQRAWAGVLMPSVDRVGRYFPFTLAQNLPALPADAAGMRALWQGLARLDELARDALFDDWTVEALEGALAAAAGCLQVPPAPPAARMQAPGGPGVAGTPQGAASAAPNWTEAAARPGLDAAAQIADQGLALWLAQAHGQAWWHARPDEAPPRLLVSHGLPDAAGLSRLLGMAATI